MENYKTSKDYKRLKDLLDKGYKVVVVMPDESIGIAQYSEEYECYDFGGNIMMQFHIPEYFEENCTDEDLEFIEPETVNF